MHNFSYGTMTGEKVLLQNFLRSLIRILEAIRAKNPLSTGGGPVSATVSIRPYHEDFYAHLFLFFRIVRMNRQVIVLLFMAFMTIAFFEFMEKCFT